jgi:MFS family permease
VLAKRLNKLKNMDSTIALNSEADKANIKLGIRGNWRQIALLALITAFVGGMVGMERSLLPKLAQQEFGIASKTAMFSFIIAFGISKAITNYFTGALSNRFGRHKLLIVGWLFALPIPWILIYAPSWNWIVAANILLGISQGIAWSSTLVMKIDLAGEKSRATAVGLNEFAGYLAVGLTTYLVAALASQYGLRPFPFYTGVIYSVLGITLSVFFIKDTRHHMKTAATSADSSAKLNSVFWGTTLRNHNLSAITQGGLVNNLNDGMAWGLFPLLLTVKGFTVAQTGVITALYPAFWGIGQLFSARASEFISKKSLLFIGMFAQAVTLLIFPVASAYWQFIVLAVLLGLGKALVYPTFTSAIADNTHPYERAESLGVFRFWRDGGYAIGAILTGILSDAFGITVAIAFVGGLTMLSSFIIKFRMRS